MKRAAPRRTSVRAGARRSKKPITQRFWQTIKTLRRENAALRREVQRLSEFRMMAYRDYLTELPNRRFFTERLYEEVARVQRSPYGFALIVIDVDELKSVNDRVGHAAGDKVLTAVARLLECNIRDVDHVCRIGGDEFAIILPDTDAVGALTALRRIRIHLSHNRCQQLIAVGLSMGVAACPPLPADAEAILKAADQAMYREKRLRRLRGGRRTGRLASVAAY